MNSTGQSWFPYGSWRKSTDAIPLKNRFEHAFKIRGGDHPWVVIDAIGAKPVGDNVRQVVLPYAQVTQTQLPGDLARRQ